MTECKTFLRGILGTGGLGGCLRRRLGSAVPEYYTVLPQLKDLAQEGNSFTLLVRPHLGGISPAGGGGVSQLGGGSGQ